MKTFSRMPMTLAPIVVACSLLASCYTTDGGAFPTTGRGFVFISTPTRPVTVTLVDTCNQETFFRMDIPAQKQLTFKFIEGSGSGARGEPTKMYWEVWEAKTEFGSLKNELICPPASCRRIDVTYRTAPEDPPVDPTLLIPPDGQPSPDGPNSVAGGPQPNGKPKD